MVQGLGKAKGATTKKLSGASRNNAGKTPKRGNGVIKPKKANVLARQKLVHRHTAGLTGLTERNLAEKAGHLELLEGGKRTKKKEAAKKAEAAAKKKG